MKKKTSFNFKLFLATRKFLAMSIAFATVASLFLIFLAYPRISGILKLRQKIDTETKKLNKYQAKARDLDQLNNLEEFQNSGIVDQVLPSHKPLLELIANLNQAAKDNKIIIEEFNISPGKIASQGAELVEDKKTKSRQTKGYEMMEVAFTANGQLKDLEIFLQKIEQLSPITSIISMSLQRKEQEVDGELLVSASTDLSLGVHYYQQSVQTTIESPLPKIGQSELAVFDTIVSFGGTNIETQTTVKDGGNENPFGIKNWQELQKELEEKASNQNNNEQQESAEKEEDLGGLLEEN